MNRKLLSGKRIVLSAVFLLSVFALISCSEVTREDLITKCITDYINRHDYQPGISVSVYSTSRDIDFNATYGKASLSDNNIYNSVLTPHYLYSITKTFTAACVLKLIKEDKLSYDNSVAEFFPDLNALYINLDSTIGELLTHRSGIQDYTDTPSLIYNNPFFKSNDWTSEKILSFIERPAQERGAFLYSSSNYIILGMIVEKIAGQPLNEYIRENFLDESKITASLYPQDDFDLATVAHPHAYPNTFMGLSGDGKTPVDITTIVPNALDLLGKCSWSAGGMIATAENTAKWGYELLSENGSIDSSLREKINSSVINYEDDDVKEAYGYGVRKLFYKGYSFIGSYGRSIGDENLMFYNKDKDICICILTNSNTKSDGSPNIDELMYAIFDVL